MSRQDIFIFRLRGNIINLGANCLVTEGSLKDAIKLLLRSITKGFLLVNFSASHSVFCEAV